MRRAALSASTTPSQRLHRGASASRPSIWAQAFCMSVLRSSIDGRTCRDSLALDLCVPRLIRRDEQEFRRSSQLRRQSYRAKRRSVRPESALLAPWRSRVDRFGRRARKAGVNNRKYARIIAVPSQELDFASEACVLLGFRPPCLQNLEGHFSLPIVRQENFCVSALAQ